MRDLWRLQHFLAVVEASSINGAARNLNMSQPALTKSIRQLEEVLGTDLLLRLPRGVRLTEAGEILHQHAREIEAAWSAAVIEIGAQSNGTDGVMRIGGGPVYCSVYFPDMLADLRQRFPNLRVQVTTGVANELLPQLRAGDIRAYAGGMAMDDDAMGVDFETVPLYRQWNTVFAAADHPLFDRSAIHPADTLSYPWLCLFSGQQANSRIRTYFRGLDLPEPRIALESHSLQIAFRMIREHRFLACMPRPLVLAEADLNVREIALDGLPWSISTGITYRTSSAGFGPIRQMVQSLGRITQPFSQQGA